MAYAAFGGAGILARLETTTVSKAMMAAHNL
jgi:hypothetical protein